MSTEVGNAEASSGVPTNKMTSEAPTDAVVTATVILPAAVVTATTAAPTAAAAAATTEASVNTTDVDTHKTAPAPKPILKEARIAVAENKAQSQINKWIKGDPPNPKVPIITKPQAADVKETAVPVVAQPVDPPAASEPEPAVSPKMSTPIQLSQDELPAVRADIIDGNRKRRHAAKTVLKSAPEPNQPVTKKPKTAATKAATPTKAKTPTKARKPPAKKATKGASRGVPEVWSGVPDEDLGEGFEWTEGWTKKKFERQSGVSKGILDRYWYTPILQKKLRSIAEVKRFMTALKEQGGDEEAAWTAFKK